MRSCVLHDNGSTGMWNRKTVVKSGVVGQIARSGFAGFGWGLFSVCWCLFAQRSSNRFRRQHYYYQDKDHILVRKRVYNSRSEKENEVFLSRPFLRSSSKSASLARARAPLVYFGSRSVRVREMEALPR